MDVQSYLDLLNRELPQLAIRSAVPVQEGWDSFVLEINDEWIFRFPRREEVLPGLEKELRLLPLLDKRLPLSVPHVEHLVRREDGRLVLLGYRKITGDRLSAVQLEQEGPTLQIAGFLSGLHNLPLELSVQTRIPYQDALAWCAEYLQFMDWACEHAFPLLPPILREQAECYWEGYLQDEANFTFRPCLIHRDLGPEHILVNGGNLSGVIDWEDAAIGDPAIDFAGLYLLDGANGVARVLSHYRRPVEPSFTSRVKFYALIAPFHEIRFGLEIDDSEHTRRGIRNLENGLGRFSPSP